MSRSPPQARGRAASETTDQWVGALAGSERGVTTSTRFQVCAGWIEEAGAGGQVDERGIIGVYCGTLAQRGVHQGPDATRYGSIKAAAAIKPDGLNDGRIETLKNARLRNGSENHRSHRRLRYVRAGDERGGERLQPC